MRISFPNGELWTPIYLVLIFTRPNWCLADAKHKFKGVKIEQIAQFGGEIY